MNKSNKDIIEWQRDFRNAPKIWYTYVMEGRGFKHKDIMNYYDSKDGADREVEYYKRKKEKPPKIGCKNLHTLDLSKRRWDE